MSGTTRGYGAGLYGTSTWPARGIHEIGGVAIVAFDAQGEMVRTWQQPSHVCETGMWTLTALPTGPPNDLELVV